MKVSRLETIKICFARATSTWSENEILFLSLSSVLSHSTLDHIVDIGVILHSISTTHKIVHFLSFSWMERVVSLFHISFSLHSLNCICSALLSVNRMISSLYVFTQFYRFFHHKKFPPTSIHARRNGRWARNAKKVNFIQFSSRFHPTSHSEGKFIQNSSAINTE